MKHGIVLAALLVTACARTPAPQPARSPTGQTATPPPSSVIATPSVTPERTTGATPNARPIVLSLTPLGELRGRIAWVVNAASPISTSGPTTLELWAIPIDGSTPHIAARYTSTTFQFVPGQGSFDTNVLRHEFSPDGRRVVLSVANAANSDRHGLVVIDLEAGRVVASLGSADEQDVSPEWSPDGTKIAFVRPALHGLSAEIWVANADLTGVRRLRAGPTGTSTILYGWTPDSQRIGFAPVYFERSSFALIDMNGVVSGQAPDNVSPNSVDPVDWQAGSPAFAMSFQDPSPSATRSDVVVGDDPAQKNQRIIADVVMNPPGSSFNSVLDPRFDPTSKTRVIYLQNGGGNSFVVADFGLGLATRQVSSHVSKAEWMADGTIVTLEEHPSTAPLMVNVYDATGKIVVDSLPLSKTDANYRLIDLAPREYQ